MDPWMLLAEGQSPRRYTPGQIVYFQGETPEAFYYLLSGSVRSFISSPDGDERILTVHRAGDLMGEASFFDECPRVSSAMVLETAEIIVIDRTRLNTIFARHPELAFPLLQYLSRTVRLLSAHVDSAFLPADRRIARYLLSLTPDGKGLLPCTHEAIGQAVGISRVTVSRTLSDFSGKGWIRTLYRKICLCDISALERFAAGE